MSTDAMGMIYLAIGIFGLVLAVCWIVLPFALIGLKPLLRDLILEQKRTNELLAKQAGERAPPHGVS